MWPPLKDGQVQPSLRQDVNTDPIAALAANIPGVPGKDYPIYCEVPESGFTREG